MNIGALLILAFGLLYTGQYERELISAEESALLGEGRLLAAALAGGGVRETLEGNPVLTEDLSRHMLRKLVEVNTLHTVLFNKTGHMLLDSHQLQGPGGDIQMVELEPPFESWPLEKKLSYVLQSALDVLPVRLHLPAYLERRGSVDEYPGVIAALAGESSSAAWYDDGGHILLTASLPVQNLKNVLGAVMVMRSGSHIEQAMLDVRMTVLKLFLAALLTTILLSVYLSETIAAPLLRLAVAAEKVGQSLLLKDTIPDLSHRRDEIGALSKALREMTGELAGRIDAISSFAADVAHEIKNPLASLKSAVETFAVVNDAARQKKLLSIIENDVDRLNRLITDISRASRMDSEISHAEKTTFDITFLLQNLIDAEMASLNLQGRLLLALETGRKLWVSGNEAQLAQVVHNLIQNAVSFLSTAGKISVSAFYQGDKVVMHIDNDGPEIPERKLETIFERFYSERPAEEKFGLHSGLGLSICRQIVRAHRGDIFARNLKDKKGLHQGVRFTVILPAGAAT